MFKVYKKEIEVAGKKISLETGKVARQADGAIIASCGETVILATVVGAKKVNPDMDYFPLSVNYQEKYYAGGKIPGGYFKREARPTESETLISRLIDRPIRPLFPDAFKNEVQLLPTVISYDKENQPDILAIIASSAALAISGMPFMGPVGASRVGFVDGKYILNPSKSELENSSLDLLLEQLFLKDKKRIDGRGLADVRQIQCEVGVLPRTHGSALFTRGETQALVVTTLGMTDDEQRLESLEGMQRSNFMLHYNFPLFQ
jgi:polyribonucleotide nucleotidyltransferase